MFVETLGRMLAASCLAYVAMAATAGCDRKEKILDIETPGGEVEVERNKDTGEVDVEVERKKGQ